MDDDSLEEQIRQTSEDSRALRELMEGERGKLRQSLEELQQLHSQVSTPISQWRECTWVPYPLPLLWDAALFHDVLMGLWPSWGTRCLQERKISPHSAHVRLAGTEIAVHTAPRPLSDVFPSSSWARSCQVKEQLIFTGISFITFETFFFFFSSWELTVAPAISFLLDHDSISLVNTKGHQYSDLKNIKGLRRCFTQKGVFEICARTHLLWTRHMQEWQLGKHLYTATLTCLSWPG